MNPINCTDNEVILWTVKGFDNQFFASKIDAESFARKVFPAESEAERYARVYFVRFYREG